MSDPLGFISALTDPFSSVVGDPFTLFAAAPGGSRGILGVDLIRTIRQSDLVGWMCYIVLSFFSVVSWAIIAYKSLHIYHANNQTDDFVELCMRGSGSLDEAYKHAGEYPDSPLAQVLRETYLELQIENWYRDAGQLSFANRLELAKVSIDRILQRTCENEMRHLESYLIFLATTAAVTPFIGLLGTVWGILGGFQALADHGADAIMDLAPSVSTALGATVFGLIAAIPAVVSYNYLSNKIQTLVTRMESFALELSNVIQKRILQQGT
ncbi:MotA/TolQ/ExbB proton channel family protein [Candidatus Sumerlaeota bacterium]|nr:MotA/TolQ/ExbB proton channel family protein [Candidatus Sumerlaeota bacterium]